jgi:hypothetical protein
MRFSLTLSRKYLILRSARRAHLEGPATVMQLYFDPFTPAFPGQTI